MKRTILATAMTSFLFTGAAQAASGMANLYVRSAAAWEHCTGKTLTTEQAERLSDLIARFTLESVSAQFLIKQAEKAQASLPAGCDLPLVRVDREYFENFVLPRISATGAQQAAEPSSPTAHG